MGLIREPKNVVFSVLNKPWTDEEKKEFSAFIKLRKEQQKKRITEQKQQNKRKVIGKILFIVQLRKKKAPAYKKRKN